MKLNSILFSTLTACAFLGGSLETRAIDFHVDPGATWNGYMNVFDTPADGGGYLWGSGWGTADLRASFAAGPIDPLTLAANINTYDDNPTDPYWVDQGTLLGNKVLEGNFFQETSGLGGQTVNFAYDVTANTLPEGYTAQAFIKVLDPDSGWATVQSTFLDLTPGYGSLSLSVDSFANPVTQVGFVVTGLNVSGTSDAALTGVSIVPEPTTFALAGLSAAALLIFRRRR